MDHFNVLESNIMILTSYKTNQNSKFTSKCQLPESWQQISRATEILSKRRNETEPETLKENSWGSPIHLDVGEITKVLETRKKEKHSIWITLHGHICCAIKPMFTKGAVISDKLFLKTKYTPHLPRAWASWPGQYGCRKSASTPCLRWVGPSTWIDHLSYPLDP